MTPTRAPSGVFSTMCAILAGFLLAALALPALALPTGPGTVSGISGITTCAPSCSTMTINTNTSRSIVNWNSFGIAAGEQVIINQPSASSAMLNRVTGSNPSQIYGQLQSNGAVWLINPSGILVGPSGQINTAGFVASTLNVSDSDFLANKLNFTTTPGAGSVVNQGQIVGSGNVYLFGPAVENDGGIIVTAGGGIMLAAAQTVYVANTATPGVTIAVSAGETAKNIGTINAESGLIQIYGVNVRNAGQLNASSITNQGGRIFLRASGGAVDLSPDSSTGPTTTSAISADSGTGFTGGQINISSTGATTIQGSLSAVGGTVTAGTTGGNLVLASGTTIAAQDINLQTDGSFANQAGAGVLNASNRWLVYSSDPASINKGGLTSAFRQYGTAAGGAVNGTGNGFIYASAAPNVAINTTNSGATSQAYGDNFAGSLGYSVSVSGGAMDNEDVANNFGLSGTATYNAPTNTSNAGIYNNIGYTGGLTSSIGSAIGAGSATTYTISQRKVALTGSRTYDGTTAAIAANLSASAGTTGSGAGVVNGDTIAITGSGTLASKNAGTEALASLGSLSISNSNYVIDQAHSSINVAKASLTISAATDSKSYDGTTSSAAHPTVTGLKGGDAITGLAQQFDLPDPGDRILTVSSYAIHDGNGGGNYTVTANTAAGTITAPPAPAVTPAAPVATTVASAPSNVDGKTSANTNTVLAMQTSVGQVAPAGQQLAALQQPVADKEAAVCPLGPVALGPNQSMNADGDVVEKVAPGVKMIVASTKEAKSSGGGSASPCNGVPVAKR